MGANLISKPRNYAVFDPFWWCVLFSCSKCWPINLFFLANASLYLVPETIINQTKPISRRIQSDLRHRQHFFSVVHFSPLGWTILPQSYMDHPVSVYFLLYFLDKAVERILALSCYLDRVPN